MDNINNSIAQQKLHELFEYRDGTLYWKVNKGNRTPKGSKAGTVCNHGYVNILIDGIRYKSHRIIFCMFNGYMPMFVDHIDNNRSNNKIENLREVTKSQNNQNARTRSDNTSGVKGVCWNSVINKWTARLNLSGKQILVGNFINLYDARIAIEEARNKLHGEFARHN